MVRADSPQKQESGRAERLTAVLKPGSTEEDNPSREKMAFGEDSAERKFWRTPELVEKLLTFLDPGSTKLLAESHDLTLQILGQAFN